MAAGTLPSPGKIVNGNEIGPCVEPCQHTDCAATRAMAAAICSRCADPIGYETRFYALGTTPAGVRCYAHAACEEDAAELERNAEPAAAPWVVFTTRPWAEIGAVEAEHHPAATLAAFRKYERTDLSVYQEGSSLIATARQKAAAELERGGPICECGEPASLTNGNERGRSWCQTCWDRRIAKAARCASDDPLKF